MRPLAGGGLPHIDVRNSRQHHHHRSRHLRRPLRRFLPLRQSALPSPPECRRPRNADNDAIADGGWLKSHPIPEGQGFFGSAQDIGERNKVRPNYSGTRPIDH